MLSQTWSHVQHVVFVCLILQKVNKAQTNWAVQNIDEINQFSHGTVSKTDALLKHAVKPVSQILHTCQIWLMYHYMTLSAVHVSTGESNLNYERCIKEWQTYECVPSITMKRTLPGADKAGLCQQPVNEDKRGGGWLSEQWNIIHLSLRFPFSSAVWSPAFKYSGRMLSSAGVQVKWPQGEKA